MWDDPVTGQPYGANDDRAYWGIAYMAYTGERKVFRCPSQKYVDFWYLPWEPFAGVPLSELKERFKYCAYGLNGYTCFAPDRDQKANNPDRPVQYRKTSDFKSPSLVIYLTDHVEQKCDGVGSDMFCAAGGSRNLTQWRGYSAQYPELYPNSIAECFRHDRASYNDYDNTKLYKGESGVLWLDGHVDSMDETFGMDVPVSWYNPF